MKICIVLGTRPQYIKFKPLYDYLLEKNKNFFVIDTNQHYSKNVSDVFIKQFKLKINYNINSENSNNNSFLIDCVSKISNILKKEKPDWVLLLGDTNSTLAGALAAHTLNIKVGHIEAGIRCGDLNRPEEINRIIVDTLSKIHFISRKKDSKNVKNPIFIGDLEYYFLNKLYQDDFLRKKEKQDWILMTLHRNENMNNDRLRFIFDICSSCKKEILLLMHHRTKYIINKYKIYIPKNIKTCEPVGYFEMLNLLSQCNSIISDSGGVTKIAPFFGKKVLIPLDTNEWDDLLEKRYAKLGMDISWLFRGNMKENKNLYYCQHSCKYIIDNLV